MSLHAPGLYLLLPGGTTAIYPTPVIVDETAFRINNLNIDGAWSNVDEHSDHHRGGSYYASMDGSIHWFNGRKKPALTTDDYQTNPAQAWQWYTRSPARGEVQLGTTGVTWAWFDRTN